MGYHLVIIQTGDPPVLTRLLFLVVLAALIASLMLVTYREIYPNEKAVVIQKKIYVVKPFQIAETREALLRMGVASAWVSELVKDAPADCFSTEILDDHRSIFSYCKLRKPLLESTP